MKSVNHRAVSQLKGQGWHRNLLE